MNAPIDRVGRRIVEVEPYGDGLMPMHPEMCPHPSPCSCIGRSGDNICGGYRRDYTARGRQFVLCGEPDTFETTSG